MRYVRGSLLAVTAATLLGGCATTGSVKRLREETQTAINQQQARLNTERAERASADSALRQDLGVIRGDVTALKSDLEKMKTDFNAKIAMLEEGLQFMMPVNFAFNDATVKDTDHPSLTRFVKIVQKYYPGSKITIEGFADPAGSARYNLDLSARRAGAVRDFLYAQGLASNEMNPIGYGETRLVAPGATHDQPGAELNRRVVFVVETKGQRSVALAPQGR
jgi:outer membrane protein OmpA-like peptidoglycan-associated protein